MKIADGHSEDINHLYELTREVYSTTDKFCSSFEELYPVPSEFGDFLADLKRRPGSVFLVARDDSDLLGYLTVEPRVPSKLRHTADLNMGVSSLARGQGAGRALLDSAIAKVQHQQVIEILYLMVRSDNEPAIRLYNQTGFELVATLNRDTKIAQNYYDGLLMRQFFGKGAG